MRGVGFYGGMRLSSLLMTIVALFALASTASGRICYAPERSSVDPLIVGSDNCCNVCPEPFYYRWPSNQVEPFDFTEDSTCDGKNNGLNLRAADKDPVFAITNGKVRPVFGKVDGYDCGCGLRLESEDGKWRALYCHLWNETGWEGEWEGGDSDRFRRVDREDVIGHVGGGNYDNPDCRSDENDEPKLHFELEYNYGGIWRRVDPESCFMNTCNYWYTKNGDAETKCSPKVGDTECQVTPASYLEGGTQYRWPTYASDHSVQNGVKGIYWYAKVNVFRNGSLDVESSNIYDLRLQKVTISVEAKDRLNDFVRLARAYSNGSIECGRIRLGKVEWDSSYCDSIVGLGLEEYDRNGSRGVSAIQLMEYLPQSDGSYDELKSNYGKWFVVSDEYVVIGVNDKDNVDKYQEFDMFNAAIDAVYYVEYVLARRCDLYEPTEITRFCKDSRIGGVDLSEDYEGNLDNEGYRYCEWNIIDAGKYYDYPGVYLSVFNFSRVSTYAGVLSYKVGEDVLSVRASRIAPESIDEAEDWNKNSGKRMLGCDGCDVMKGNLACSLGSSLAQNRYFFQQGTQPFYPDADTLYKINGVYRVVKQGCGFWSPTAADYYGFSDLDDDAKLDADNHFDKSYDKESGMPVKPLVYNSIISIKSNVSGYWIRDVDWRKPPYWVNLYDKFGGDTNSIFNPYPDYAATQDWLMPCGKEAKYKCGPSDNPNDIAWDAVPIDEAYCRQNGFTACTDYVTFTDTPPGHQSDCNYPRVCKNSGGESCPIHWRTCNPHPAWRCIFENPATGENCGDICCLGGVEIKKVKNITKGLNYTDYPLNRGASGDDCNDNIGDGSINGITPYETTSDSVLSPNPMNPAILPDDDYVRDRYWVVVPVEGNANWGSKVHCTRPGYNRLGGSPGDSTTSTSPGQPTTTVGSSGITGMSSASTTLAGGATSTTNPGGGDGSRTEDRPTSLQHNPCKACDRADTCPEYCMNYDLKYFRQFNIDSIWARIFKASPEVNLYFDESGRAIVDANPACEIQKEPPDQGKASMGDGCNSTYNCSTNLECKPSGFGHPETGHCCPTSSDMGYDLSYGCCKRCYVNDSFLYDVNYCQRKIELGGSSCKCELGEGNCRSNDDCASGLKCKDNIYSAAVDSACCMENQNWTGKDCIPKDLTPWWKSYTRTIANSPDENGGGLVGFVGGGGGMIPTKWEAAGDRLIMDCDKARRFQSGPSPIWFETKNLGKMYGSSTSVLCNNPGLFCWSIVKPFRGGTQECRTNDCNCGRDMDQNGDKEDAICPGGPGGSPTSTVPSPGSTIPSSSGPTPASGTTTIFSSGSTGSKNTACRRGTTQGNPHTCKYGPGDFSKRPEVNSESMPVPPDAGIIPATCGEIYRKDVLDWPDTGSYESFNSYQAPDSKFTYNIQEDSGDAYGGRNNALPQPTDPWTVLKVEILPPSGTRIVDNAKSVSAETDFTLTNKFRRKVIVEECRWYGCSRLEEILTNANRQILSQDCPNPPPSTAQHCIGCPENCQNFKSNDYNICCKPPGQYCERTCQLTDDQGNTYTGYNRWRDDCTCEYLCWGCWHHEGLTYNYPVSKYNSETKKEEIEYEEFKDTSTVKSDTYGDHLKLEGIASAGNSPFDISIEGNINKDAPWKKLNVNGYLTIRVVDRETGFDMLNGFDVVIPEVLTLKFVSTDYAYSHELTSLESAQRRERAFMTTANSDFLDHGLNETKDSKFKMVNNPLKKYSFRQDNYKSSFTRYTRNIDFFNSVTLQSPSRWWPEISQGIGLFNNYQEDYSSYYDLTGFTPRPLDVEAFSANPQPGLADTTYNVVQIPYSTLFMQNVNAKVKYAPDCNNAPYKTQCGSIGDCDPNMCNENSNLECNGECTCKYKDGEPIKEDICKGTTFWTEVEMDCDDPRSPIRAHCADKKYQAYWKDTLILQYKWDKGAGMCKVEVLKECERTAFEPNSYTLLFNGGMIDPKDYAKTIVYVYTPFRRIEKRVFHG